MSHSALFNSMDCSMPGFPIHHYLLGFAQAHVHWVNNAIQLSQPLPPLLLQSSIFPSIRVSPIESALCIRWPKDWSLSFSISPFSEYSGLISFGVDWFDSLQSKGLSRVLSSTTVKKASVLWCSVFFIVQLSHPYMTTGKTIALTIWTFVGKVMSLLFNTKSRFIIVFLPRCKCRLISWL